MQRLSLLVVVLLLQLIVACGDGGTQTPTSPPPPPANRAPTASAAIPDQSVEEGAEVTVDVSGAFSDPDEDALSYEATSDAPGMATVSVAGSDVTVSGEAAGTATVTVSAADPGGLSANQTFEVTVSSANQAPTVSAAIPDQSVEEGAEVTVDVSGAFSDPDGDALSYEATSGAPGVATVSVAGSDVTVSGEAAGTATVTVSAADPGGLSATQSFEVTVEAAGGGGSQALTGEITLCIAEQLFPGSSSFSVRIGGTLTAHRDVTFVQVEGWANFTRVGFDSLGRMSAGESKSFSIFGVVSLTGTTLVCSIDVEYRAVSSQAQYPVAKGAGSPYSLHLSRVGGNAGERASGSHSRTAEKVSMIFSAPPLR